MKTFETFLKLHQQSTPLLIGNIWDVQSAKLFNSNGFKAIGTSSAAVANSFGYEDGEQVPFALIVQLAKRVVEVVDIPFSVDIEGGFGRTVAAISENIERLYDVGVVGINIEDSLPGKPRTLQSPEVFAKTLNAIANTLSKKNAHVFINVRTDGFLLGLPHALAETAQRINIYENTGVHGVFVPCIEQSEDIRVIVSSTKLPINVMCMPQLPSFDALQKLGVKRISMGNSLHQFMLKGLKHNLEVITKEQSFKNLF
jgi:2-methylisocitrate lyase-like PEP mutase family enzyme